MLTIVSKNPVDLLLSEECRRFLAADRWKKSERQQVNVHDGASAGVMPGTVAHNRRETEQGLFGSSKRTRRLINPLSGLEPVYSQAERLTVLSIGPRTEMEIFSLMGIGFQLRNIAAIDLVSSSPLIDTGDMHDMPYEDRAFDVVISSWVIAYSSQPQQAIDEMLRVCKDGGIVAIGVTYEPTLIDGIVANRENATDITGTNYKTATQLMELIGSKLDRVYFQQEPEIDGRSGPVMLIAKIRH